jgi:hypothetical protein
MADGADSAMLENGPPAAEWDTDSVKALRGSAYRRDGSIVDVLRGRPIHDVLQMAGDALIDATTQHVSGAAEVATQWATALRQRDWEGDVALAEQIDAVLGSGATPLLRPLPVDLEELADLREGDPLYGDGRVDLRTGQCWPAVDDYLDPEADEDNEDDDEHWLYVPHTGSHDGYHDMESFIATVTDPGIADRLEIAITGKGAFRRFKDVLSRWPGELQRYYLLSGERQLGRARAWLAAEGYRPAAAASSPKPP